VLSSSGQDSEGGGDSNGGDSFAAPAKNLNKVFWVFLVVSPLFNHYQGYE
jgi:hypothetical protein